MTPLQRKWSFLSKKHGLIVDIPFTLHLPSGKVESDEGLNGLLEDWGKL